MMIEKIEKPMIENEKPHVLRVSAAATVTNLFALQDVQVSESKLIG